MRGVHQLAWVAAVALSACATPGPYAVVSGERPSFADPHEASVRIMGVDGRLDPSGPSSVMVEPGPHILLMRTTRRDGRRMSPPGRPKGEYRRAQPEGAPVSPDATLALDAKACTRYIVVAKHGSSLQVEPWGLELKKTEPIAECLAKLPMARPGKAGGG